MDTANNLEHAARYVRAAILGDAAADGQWQKRQAVAWARDTSRAVPSRYTILIPIKNRRYLAYNSVSGSLALWNQDDMNLYTRLAAERIPVNAAEMLDMVVGGFALSEKADELGQLERQYRQTRFTPGVMNLTIAPTLGCNFACDYCFQGKGKSLELMNPEVAEAVIEHVRQQAPTLKRLQVTWYGGEPSLAPKTIISLSQRLIPLCKEAKVYYNAFMVTNGFLLTRKLASELSRYGVRTYQVTLDGPEDYHDQRRCLLGGGATYDKIVGNLCDIVKNNVPVAIMIRINIDERNRGVIRRLLDDLAQRGLAGRKRFRVYFAPVRASTVGCHSCNEVTMQNLDYGRTEAELHDYALHKGLTSLPYPPRFLGNCQAVRPKGMIVLPNGDLHKCWDTVASSDMKVGTIFALPEFFNGEQHQRWLQWTPFQVEACRQCAMLPNCMGFCSYKHLHREMTLGEAGSIPCPSWKYNLNERLFLRAKARGFVSAADWDETHSPTAATARGTFWTLPVA